MNAILNLTPCLRSVFSHWISAPISRSICHLTPSSSVCRLGSNDIGINGLFPSGILGHQPIRTGMRKHFDRPSEIKRIRKHGWLTRMSTPSGRRIIMRRMLKGRHVLSH